jgi:hypothetical protein
MATQPTNPFQNSSGASSAVVPASQARMALDNLIRRELKVGDPNDPKLVAEALLARYKDSPRAIAISREAEGVPFLLAPTTPLTTPAATTSSDAEMQQATDDVNRDLAELTTNTILKDITPELQGWATAIRSAIQEGINAARFSLDRIQRDKVFGIRRMLGDYARMARLVGALTPSTNVYYRKFAQSLDEVASVLLVMMGEALANAGFGSGRFLLQAPYSELRGRRDMVISALRNLMGSAQEAYEPSEYQRGLHAYRQIYKELENQGQGDLRVLLVENELSRMMDELIQRADHGRVEGLRALGATAQLDLERMRRLVIVGNDIAKISPELTSFLDALLLFIEGFDSSGGFRLLRIARPTILSYGLYGSSNSQGAEDTLVQLTYYRNRLADQLDCFMQCGCDPDHVRGQIILDKLLYDVDRAIDLYSVGNTKTKHEKTDPGPERRAVAYGYVINLGLRYCLETLDLMEALVPLFAFDVPYSAGARNAAGITQAKQSLKDQFSQTIAGTLHALQQLLLADNVVLPAEVLISSETDHPPTRTTVAATSINVKLIPSASFSIADPTIEQELCIQHGFEKRWHNLVNTMATTCLSTSHGHGIFDALDEVLTQARQELVQPGGNPDIEDCGDVDVDVPAPSDRSRQNVAIVQRDTAKLNAYNANLDYQKKVTDAGGENTEAAKKLPIPPVTVNDISIRLPDNLLGISRMRFLRPIAETRTITLNAQPVVSGTSQPATPGASPPPGTSVTGDTGQTPGGSPGGAISTTRLNIRPSHNTRDRASGSLRDGESIRLTQARFVNDGRLWAKLDGRKGWIDTAFLTVDPTGRHATVHLGNATGSSVG